MVSKRSQKIEAQVVDAIRNLQAVQGSTLREISKYISQEYDLSGPEVKRQVQIALKRGVTYGILQRLKGGCYTYNQDLLNGHPLCNGDNVEIPHSKRRRRMCRGGGGRRRRRSRSRRRSRRRKGRRSRRARRTVRGRSGKTEEVPKEIDGLELKTLTKQPKRSSSLLRKDAPGSDGSSTSGNSDEKQE